MKPMQARAARAILQLGVREVAKLADVTPNTVSRVEQEDIGVRGPNPVTVHAIRRVYEEQGIVFLGEGETTSGGAGVRRAGPASTERSS